jgi:beta-aspartyl-peptidase (threonine type)
MLRPMTRLLGALLLLLLLPCACASYPAAPQRARISRGAVELLLEDQRQAWNRGDWAGFIAGYWDHPQLTFGGASGITRGRRDLLRRFRENYPDAKARGLLTFHVLEFRPIGRSAALVLGRYQLDRATPASGYFSLVVERTLQGIKITHDHTSESPPQQRR